MLEEVVRKIQETDISTGGKDPRLVGAGFGVLGVKGK